MMSSLMAQTLECFLPLWLSQQPGSANMPYQKPVQDAKALCAAYCGKRETETSRV